MRLTIFFLLGLSLSFRGLAGEIHTGFPENIDPAGTYVFYSHGLIVEGNNPKPVHPKFGVYDFPAIKSTLAGSGFDLIAYHRPANTDPRAYALQLAKQVKTLVKAGVRADRITILGFSIGGLITALTSDQLKNKNINVIIMAGCSPWLIENAEVKIYGRFLSVYETSDAVGSCGVLAERSKGIGSFDEIAITTGKGHGAFYKPIDDWVLPVLDWILRQCTR